MAELHGRILRLPHRRQRLVGPLGLALALALALASTARAERGARTAASLAALAQDLGSAQAETREAAIVALSTLPPDALPAIEARIAELVEAPVRSEDAYEVLRAFAHAVGSRDASDPIDILPGVAPVLAEGRSRVRRRVAERLLLLRSLEHMGTARGLVVALRLLGPELETFRWETQHIATRSGARAAAMLLRASGTVGTGLVKLGKRGLERAGLNRPATALAGQSDESIVEIVRAYGAILHMDAMPAVADLVDDDRPGVQAAAREAMERYGQNGIWQLRRVMTQRLGVEPQLDLSWRATMHALYEGLDAKRLAPDYAALDAALALSAEGRTEEAVRALDALLAQSPELPRRREMAPVYAARGRDALDAGRFAEARDALERARGLDGSHPDGGQWRAEQALAEAELALAAGQPSLALFEEALGSPQSRARAEAHLRAEAPAEPEAAAPLRPPPALLAALGAALLLLPTLLRGGRRVAPVLGALARASARALAGHAKALAGHAKALAGHARAFVARLARRTLRARAALSRASRAPLSPLEAPATSEPAAPAVLDVEGPPTLVDELPPAPLMATMPAPAAPAAPRRVGPRPRAVMPAELLFGGPGGRSIPSASKAPSGPTRP